MRLSLDSLPDIVELTDFNGSISCVYEGSESNAIINSFTMSPQDSGISLSVNNSVNPPVANISGRYEQQFTIGLSWTEPQVDIYTPPVTQQASNWGDVPNPGNPNIWFLYEFKPPDILVNTITYTLDISWQDSGAQSGIFTATQNVRFDVDANNIEFQRYV